MRAKSMLLLLVAIGCGVVASVAVSQIVLDKKENTQTAEILVLTKNLSALSKINADSIRLEKWPIDRIPQGAFTDPKLAEGKFAKQPLYANEPLIEIKLSDKGKDLFVPEGYRVFDLQVNDNTGGSGYISPGDRVDVFGFFGQGIRNKTAAQSQRVMENLEVFMVDGNAQVDPDQPTNARRSSSTFQLLVRDKQYTVLDTAQNLGKLRVALRPPQKDEKSNNKLDEGENFLNWLKASEASKSSESSYVSDDYSAPVNRVEHEMTIITPEGANRFQWKNGEKIPQKVDDGESAGVFTGISTAGIQSGTPPAATPPYMQDPTTGTKPTSTAAPPGGNQPGGRQPGGMNSSGANTGTVRANPPPSTGTPRQPNQPNTVWDSNTGTWQVGGFNATYPGAK